MWIPTNDELEFAEMLRDLLRSRDVLRVTRNQADDPMAWNRELWDELQGLGIGELMADGEVGAAVVAAETLGGYPAGIPLMTQAVLVPILLRELGVDQAQLSGRVVAIGPFSTHGNIKPIDSKVESDSTLTVDLSMVLHASWADSMLLLAGGQERMALLRVDLHSPGVHVVPRGAIDPTISFADVRLDRVPVEVLIEDTTERVHGALETAEWFGMLWASAAEVGTARRLLDMAVDYAKQRVQFGMPIGKRQAIKHRAANMLMQIESAASAVAAVADLSSDASDSAQAASLMRIATSRAVDEAAQSAFQIHGGIGFTWEHDLHFLLKRALASRTLFGGSDHHRSRLIKILKGDNR